MQLPSLTGDKPLLVNFRSKRVDPRPGEASDEGPAAAATPASPLHRKCVWQNSVSAASISALCTMARVQLQLHVDADGVSAAAGRFSPLISTDAWLFTPLQQSSTHEEYSTAQH